MSASLVGRDTRLTAIVLALVLGVAYAYFYQGGGWNQNTRFAMVRAIIEQGTLRIDDTGRYEGRMITGDLARHDGHIYCDKAPGLQLLAVVPVAIFHPLLVEPTSRGGIAFLSYLATVTTAGLPTVLAALLIFWVAARMGASQGAAIFAALVYGLATPAWCYATLFYGHALASACVIAAFAAAVALQPFRNAMRDWMLALGIGVAGGWATITEYPSAIPAAMMALFALVAVWPDGTPRRLRVIVGVGVGASVCIAAIALYNHAAFGSALTLGYSNEAGDFHGMKQGVMGVTYPKLDVLWQLLFSRFRGLLYFAPVLVLAPVGIAMMIRTPSTSRLGIVVAEIAIFYVLFNAAYYYWDGGWSYAPRHMAPMLPFLALALAPLWSRATLPIRIGLAALALYSAAGTLVAVSTTAQPPDTYKQPFTQLLWPNFVVGHLSLNQQAFVEDDLVKPRDSVAHMWNLGEQLGFTGHASLVPLFVMWLAIVAGGYAVQQWPEPAPGKTDAG